MSNEEDIILDAEQITNDVLLENAKEDYKTKISKIDKQKKIMKNAAIVGTAAYGAGAGISGYAKLREESLLRNLRKYNTMLSAAESDSEKEILTKRIREIEKKLDHMGVMANVGTVGRGLGAATAIAGVGGQFYSKRQKADAEKDYKDARTKEIKHLKRQREKAMQQREEARQKRREEARAAKRRQEQEERKRAEQEKARAESLKTVSNTTSSGPKTVQSQNPLRTKSQTTSQRTTSSRQSTKDPQRSAIKREQQKRRPSLKEIDPQKALEYRKKQMTKALDYRKKQINNMRKGVHL